jgi:hypothetical protein
MTAAHGDERLPKTFWSKAVVSDPPPHQPDLGPCWLWSGSTNQRGYGYYGWQGKIRLAHCVARRVLVGEWPDELQLDHLCRRRQCCRPSHLEPVTSAENNRRSREARGLEDACGKGHPWTEETLHIDPKGARVCKICREADRLRIFARLTGEPDANWLTTSAAGVALGVPGDRVRSWIESGVIAGTQIRLSNGKRRWLARAESVRVFTAGTPA